MARVGQPGPRLVLSTAVLALLVLLGACGGGAGEGAISRSRIVLTGSSTLAPLMLEIGKRFEEEHAGVRVDVQSGGSSRGIADVRNGVADIGMVSRSLKPDEADLEAFTVARDGIGVIVHSENSVTDLTDQQVRDIYTGKITDWRALDGAEGPITVVNKAEGRSTLELFLDYFALEPEQIRAQVVIGENEQGIKTVAGNPGAIGYVSIGAAESAAQQGSRVRLVKQEGVQASTENVRNGTFPLTRDLNLVTKGAPSETARQFIEYALSPEVSDLVINLFFVPLE